ncbi:hypothetical protein D3C80_1272760 [compost metagenome]
MRQAVDALAVHLLAKVVLAQFKQRPRIIVNEFRVPLEAQDLIADVVGRIRAEIARGNHRGVFRQSSDLILVTDQQGQLLDLWAHPRCFGVHNIAVGPHPPALCRTLALAAQ